MTPRSKDDGYSNKRRREEDALDQALENTFPASDPVSVEQPTLFAINLKQDEMPSAGHRAQSEIDG